MEVSSESETQTEVEKSVETAPQTNESQEENNRTPCEALPGWTRVVVSRKTGNSAGKSDVYYYSPTGKKVRSKPDLEKVLEIDGQVKDLSKFDYRTGLFVERNTTRKRKKQDLSLADLSMASTPFSKKIANGSVTLVSNNLNSSANGLDLHLEHVPNGASVGLVSPRQIYWERQLQNMNTLVDFDIFSDTNGEFRSLLHSIVSTLEMERHLANRKTTTDSEENHKTQKKKPLKITKADIRKQEKQVIKARRELAKAMADYEVLKYS